MNETIKKLLLMSGGKMKYGTAGTTTTTTLASSGGLLINIDSATGDIASTTTNTWLESNSALGFYNVITAGASNEADTAVTRTGTKTLKLSTTNATGLTFVAMLPDGLVSPLTGTFENGFVVKPSTKYKLSCWVKTNNVAAASTYINFTRERNASGTIVGSNTLTSTLSGTNDWTLLTCTKTTAATAVYSSIFLVGAGVTGNTGDAWFDINSMTLEEVVEPVANSLTSSSPSLVSFTAVGSTDNINQSQLSTTNSLSFSVVAQYQAQQLITTKSKFTGVTLYKKASVGSPTGTMTFSIVNDNAAAPGTTVYATSTMSNATYIALADNAEFTVNLPCNIPAGTYWLKISYSVSSATDYPVIGALNGAGSYTGLYKYGIDGVTYGVTFAGDAYFKTLYYKPTTNFTARQNNSTMQISADEDGFLDGSVINLTTGRYSFAKTYINSVTELGKNDNYSFTSGGGSLLDGPTGGLPVSPTTFGVNSITYKINGVFPLSSIILSITAGVPATRSFKVQYSPDNGVTPYVDLYTYTNADNLLQINTTVPLSGVTVFYLKFVSVTNICYIRNFLLSATIDTSSITTLRNYPTNKDIIKQYSTTLGSATTSATYRATKWGFPAIEYSEIDQSQLSFSGNVAFGTASQYQAQQFTPTQTSFVGVTFYKKANTGSPSGTMTFSIVNDSANVPGTTVYATYVMSNAEYLALTTNAEFTVNLPCYLPAGTYWIKISYSVSSGTDFPLLGATGGAGAYPGLYKYGTDGITYGVTFAGDVYFKSLYADTYQFLDVDTTGASAVVSFSELGSSYTTVADGASLTITSTSTPNLFVKVLITVNRLYVSSNDLNASSDKDGSLKQSVIYKVMQ